MRLAVLLIGAALAATSAHAAWPERQLTVIVPYAPGSATDTLARALGETMREQLGQQIVIVNRDGASSTIGAAAIAQAKPDGYTFGFTAIGPITIQPHLNPALAYARRVSTRSARPSICPSPSASCPTAVSSRSRTSSARRGPPPESSATGSRERRASRTSR